MGRIADTIEKHPIACAAAAAGVGGALLAIGGIVSRWQAAQVAGAAMLSAIGTCSLYFHSMVFRMGDECRQHGGVRNFSGGEYHLHGQATASLFGLIGGSVAALLWTWAAQLPFPRALRKISAAQMAIPTVGFMMIGMAISHWRVGSVVVRSGDDHERHHERVDAPAGAAGLLAIIAVPLVAVAARYIPFGTFNLFRG